MFSSNLAASLGLTSANATTGSHEGQTQSVSKTAEKVKRPITVGQKKTRTAMEFRNLAQQKKWVGVPYQSRRRREKVCLNCNVKSWKED